jgi:serine protease Do
MKNSKGMKRILSLTALCLAALLILGAAGYGVTSYFIDHPIRIVSTNTGDTSLDNNDSGYISSAFNIGNSSTVLSATEIYKIASNQTVGISTEVTTTNVFGQAVSGTVTGTGFILTADGYIMTNYHVIKEAYQGGYEIKVMLHDGSSYTAKIVGIEDDNDIAVLKIDAKNLSAVTLADSSKMEVGEPVYAIGNPLGELTYTFTGGMVSALDRDITGEDGTTINMFQIDAAVNSGNSGGPVYNSEGEVIGVVTAKYSSTGVEGLGFAIPINDAAEIATQLIQYGYVTGKPALGISVQTISEQAAKYYNLVPGVSVGSVTSGSCAEKAGILKGDIITKLGDKEITTTAELLAAYKAGDTTTVTVYRSGSYKTLTLTFDEEKPAAPGTAASDGAVEDNSSKQQQSSWPFGNWPFGN